MADFRKYSEKYPFRQRSETPEIAVELSLQPWRRFGVDGVIMFSGSFGRRSTLLPVIPLVPIIIVGLSNSRYPHAPAGNGNRLHDY